MSNANIASAQLMMQQLNIHSEMAKGAISITPNPKDLGVHASSFTELMKNKVAAVNADQNASAALITAVDTGQSGDLVGAMVASQKAGLAFSAMIQIRNRLVQAFDEVMKMPI
ncbi:flagellar hook-basal body complex protein FliE [Shewanella sairae]|uniref:Flagellar hook-basal body complex protein FliE n=1 Tax=Shewanella sairae TaxID=190310 RepID=A0ABQ4PLB2_9GAMM|nr:flagellar hook-basal body complex protein FliE [Shewanella sairae]GIU48721.1 flagellar hook-basal body complex protein FliE [Shewanella sairae]